MAGIKRGYVQAYLNEFMWWNSRCNNRVETFDKFIELIKKFYPTQQDIQNTNEIETHPFVEDLIKLDDMIHEIEYQNDSSSFVEIIEDLQDDDDRELDCDFVEFDTLSKDLNNLNNTCKKKSVFNSLLKKSEASKNIEIEKLGLQEDTHLRKGISRNKKQNSIDNKLFEENVMQIIQNLKTSHSFSYDLNKAQRGIIHKLAEKKI